MNVLLILRLAVKALVRRRLVRIYPARRAARLDPIDALRFE